MLLEDEAYIAALQENLPKYKEKYSDLTDSGLKWDLQMCDFSLMEKALKIAWVNRVQNKSSASWKIIPNYLLRHHGNLAFLSNCNYNTKTLKLGNLLDFYCSLLEYWQYVNKIGSR